ncbi:hypothetical protein LR48_Vigan09g050800 [Vigna angularis]|uniref:Uncharacterized protein n=1 Tax=Phaseolus angularis TaxID=3914 RepID=A0A0L9VB17_PHAAN|nr:hypothetical protein LR48_Vigan09g050800 [Vigna angularis]
MASSSSSSRRKGKAINVVRNVDPTGWISDEETHEVFLRWKRIKTVISHRYLDLDLFRKEGFHCPEWFETQGVDVIGEKKLSCERSNAINRMTLTSIGLVKTINGCCFKDEENIVASSRSSPTLNKDRTNFIPETNFERFVIEQFSRLELKVDFLYQNKVKNDSTIEDSDEESTEQDYRQTSDSE